MCLSVCTVPLTSNLSVHACPLASDSKAARVRRPRYSRVNIHAYASAIRVTRVCARVTSARSTRERISIASIPRPLPPRKKVEGLGTRLACPLRVNLVHAFERERVRFRVLACTRASTRVCVCEYSRATREGCQVARERHCMCICVCMTLPDTSVRPLTGMVDVTLASSKLVTLLLSPTCPYLPG